MKYFDTHAHLNFPDYDEDRAEVIEKTLREGIFMVNIGTDIKESKKVIEIAGNYKKGVYSSVGLHPLYVDEGFDYKLYKEIASAEKVVAVGETGLDYKYLPQKNEEERREIEEKQKEIFKKHIKLSKELNLPLVLHCRSAHQEMISILKKHKNQTSQSTNKAQVKKTQSSPREDKLITREASSKFKGVVHCFTGNVKEAREYIDLGFSLGLNGIIFKVNLKEVIYNTPLEKIVLETDAPFLTPPEARRKRNEPLFIKYVAEEIAKIKDLSVKEVVKITTKNALKLFEIK